MIQQWGRGVKSWGRAAVRHRTASPKRSSPTRKLIFLQIAPEKNSGSIMNTEGYNIVTVGTLTRAVVRDSSRLLTSWVRNHNLTRVHQAVNTLDARCTIPDQRNDCLMPGPADVKSVSPRLQLAARLYATGLAPTKRAASEAAGLHPHYLTLMSNENELVKRLVNETREMIDDQTIDISVLMKRLGRQAVGKIATLMETASNEGIQLKAAQDLADRNSETQKVQKIDASVAAFTLAGADVAALTQAMLESARLKEQFKQIAEDGLVEVTDLQTPPKTEAA